MAVRLNTNTGCYYPGIFKLHIDTYDTIPAIKDMKEEMFNVFLHEYVHYIQAVTTTSGFYNLYCMSEYMHSVINRIYKIPQKEFQIPFEITDNNDKVQTNIEILNASYGDGADKPIDSIHEISIEEKTIDIDEIKGVREIVIASEMGEKRIFGTLAIMESMAYLMEKMCGTQTSSPDFPYDIAKRVAAMFSPEFATNTVNVIALCDMSLMCSNPGGMFISFLHALKDETVYVQKPEDIVDWFYALQFQSYDGKPTTLMEYFREISTVTLSSLLSYIKVPELEEDIIQYFSTMFANVWNLRSDDPYFIIRLAQGGHALCNRDFLKIVKNIGFPLVENDNHENFLLPSPLGNAQLLTFFGAVGEVYKTFSEGQEQCGMLEWCKISPDSSYNTRCQSAPWMKHNEDKLCPYAMLWKHWNLADHTPVYETDY